MPRFQSILLSVIWVIFSPSTIAAAGDAIVLPPDEQASIDTKLPVDNIMIRQTQPIKGFQALTVAGQEINATFLEETLGEPHGAIILLHDLGEDLESRGVITPLRHQLLQYGWSTLSVTLDYPYTAEIILSIKSDAETDGATNIELPVIPEDVSTEIEPMTDTDLTKADDSDNEQVVPLPAISNKQRIEAAIEFLKAKDIKRIIFLGHGRGGSIAIEELPTIATRISALILVGTPELETHDEFKKLPLPILDIFGSQDLQGVSAAVHDRKIVMKRNGNIGYTSREIIGANHVFYGAEPLLISTVRGWLHNTFVKQEESK